MRVMRFFTDAFSADLSCASGGFEVPFCGARFGDLFVSSRDFTDDDCDRSKGVMPLVSGVLVMVCKGTL